MLCRFTRQPGIIHQPDIKGRHAHHGCGAGQAAEHIIGVKFRHENHRGAGKQHDIGRDKQACVWKIGRACSRTSLAVKRQVSTSTRAFEARFSWLSIAPFERPVVPMCKGWRRDHPARAADPRTCLRPPAPCQPACVILRPQRFQHRAGGLRNRCQRRSLSRRTHEDTGLGIAEEILDFCRRIGIVERQKIAPARMAAR